VLRIPIEFLGITVESLVPWVVTALVAASSILKYILDLRSNAEYRAAQERIVAAKEAQIAQGQETVKAKEATIESLKLLNYSDALRHITAARGSLSQAAHELRLPVSHIKGLVSTLRRRDVKVDDETRDDFLGEMEQEIDRVSELIDGLLEESRAGDRRQSRIPRRATRPASLVEGGLDRVRRRLQGRCVEVNIARDLPLVEVDGPAIERVIPNLVQNALKYALADSHIRLSAQVSDDALELRVEDDGPGIPSCDRKRIFARVVSREAGESIQSDRLWARFDDLLVDRHCSRWSHLGRFSARRRYSLYRGAAPTCPVRRREDTAHDGSRSQS
jgi:K+-sensing histidine kinase KdpD